MGTERAIGHLDSDCFYVSAERVRDDFLRNKPVAVLGNQGACVIAKSYEMKARGVKTGEPIWEAMEKCPDGVYLKRDFRWYEVLSRMMLAVVREWSPRVEYYSIDEFFFEFFPLRNSSPQETAVAIRDTILERVRVPVTVGIARTKTLAKLISDTAKPFGAKAVLDRKAERELLANLAVTEVSGIGSRRAERLSLHGITTSLQFAEADRRFIRSLLTVVGERLWWELNGEAVEPLHTERPPHKMISRGGSLGVSTSCPERLFAWLVRNLERLIEELEYYAVRAGKLEVLLCYKDGRVGLGRASPLVPSDRFDHLLEAGKLAFQKAFLPGGMATRMHLTATELKWPSSMQAGLFEMPGPKAEALAKVKREVNARFGRFALRSGATLPLSDIYKDESNGYDICDVRGKICF
jgi:nucleotidyltransferase/DNA polymerase involved in DNA repair